MWSYELGEKLRLGDNRVTINSAAYFENWSGVQQTNSLSPCGFIYAANAGDAHVYGGEIEARAALSLDWALSANTAYTHAALVSTDFLSSSFQPGTPIQDVPKWTASANLAYRHSVSDRLAFTALAEATYTGSRTDQTYSVNTLPSYELSNVRAGLQGTKWSATLFVNNLADKRALLNDVTQAAVNLATYNRVVINQPRTFGVTIRFNF